MINIDALCEDEVARQKSLEELFSSFGRQQISELTRLQDIPFNVRCQNCLLQAGLETLGSLNIASINSLLSLPAFGWGTLTHLLDIYALTFSQASSVSQASFDFLDAETRVTPLSGLFPVTPSLQESLECDFNPLHTEYPLTRLSLPTRAGNILRTLGVQTIGQVLALSSYDIASVPNAGAKTVADIEQALRHFAALPPEQQEAEIVDNDQSECLETAGRRDRDALPRLLIADDVIWTFCQWCREVRPKDYGCDLTEGFFPCRRFDTYQELILAVLEQIFKQPRRRDVFIDYFGLFSTPLSRLELVEKYGVSSSRIYQMLTLNERTLNRFRSLRAAFVLPVAHLLQQHRGLLSVSDLERGLAEQFNTMPGTVRGVGLLEMLSEYPEALGIISIMGRRERMLALSPPVTPTILEALVNNVHRHLVCSPDGLNDTDTDRIIHDFWKDLLPDCPVPIVPPLDLAWLHPKIVVEDGIWRALRRNPKPRVTDRITIISMLETILAKNGRPMMVQDLFTDCRKEFGEINIPACRTATQKNPNLFRSYGRGILGLSCWGDFMASEIEAIRTQSRRNTPRTVLDKIEAVLEDNGVPMQFQNLFRALQDRFEEVDERTVRQGLIIRPERFQGHGNGIYGLTAWGEDAAIILEQAVVEFLEQRGYASSETEICDGLGDQFTISVPVCRWALRRVWKQSGSVVPLEGALWEVADEEPSELSRHEISVDELLFEQLMSC